jgi:hypothetical protein
VQTMLVRGISRADLEAAVEIASGTLGNRLELYAMYPANRRRGNAWRFRVKVRSLTQTPPARVVTFAAIGSDSPRRPNDPITLALTP